MPTSFDLAKLLSPHLDQQFVQHIINGLEHGFNTGYDGVRTSQHSRNLPTASAHPDFVSNQLSESHRRGETAGPYPHHFPPCDFQELGWSPKEGNKLRPIHHLMHGAPQALIILGLFTSCFQHCAQRSMASQVACGCRITMSHFFPSSQRVKSRKILLDEAWPSINGSRLLNWTLQGQSQVSKPGPKTVSLPEPKNALKPESKKAHTSGPKFSEGKCQEVIHRPPRLRNHRSSEHNLGSCQRSITSFCHPS